MKSIPRVHQQIASVIFAFAICPIASAHTKFQALGKEAGATDYYWVNCTTGDANAARLEVSIQSTTASSAKLSVQVQRKNIAANATDPVGGDGVYSPTISVVGGDGVYDVIVDKAGSGSVNYALEYHCKTGGGVHTGDDTTIEQNQNDSSPQPVDAKFEPTEIKDQAVEGTTLYTGLVVNQGCQDDQAALKALPVIAHSAVFPNDPTAKALKINQDGTETEINNLASEIEGAVGGGVMTLSPGMVQDKSLFQRRKEISLLDNNGTPSDPDDDKVRVRALNYSAGKLPLTSTGVVPFMVTVPKFVPNSCARRLSIRIAAANWCSKSKKLANRADIWIGHKTSLFNDDAVMPHDFVNKPYWPTLIVNRDIQSNPLGGGCGEGYDIAVQPADTDIDKFLPMKGFWPK